MAVINKINADGALLWIFVGDIIRNTEPCMTASERFEPPDKRIILINFTYCAAGAMADADYTRQSAAVKGKGLLVSITGRRVTFKYYDLDGNPLPYDCTVDISKAGPAAAAYGPFAVTFLGQYDRQGHRYPDR